jgi:hypothetical protein
LIEVLARKCQRLRGEMDELLLMAVGECRVDSLRALLAAGATLGATTEGLNALEIVFQCGKPASDAVVAEICQLLFFHGADVQLKDARGHPPLEQALLDMAGPETVRVLLEHGAKIGSAFDVILQHGCHSEQVLALLIQAGGHPGSGDVVPSLACGFQSKSFTSATLKMFCLAGADPNDSSEKFPTALCAAVMFDIGPEFILTLMECGADRNKKWGKQLPVQIAATALKTKDSRNARAYLKLLCPTGLEREFQVKRSKEEDVRVEKAKPLWFQDELSFCAKCRIRMQDPSCCGGCGLVGFCGKECQRAMWKEHKPICLRKQLIDKALL